MFYLNVFDIINICNQELGYIEKASNYDLYSKTGNRGLNNYTKYSKEINEWGLKGYQGSPWCCSHQFWVEVKAYGLEKALKRWHMTKEDYVGYNVFATRNKFPANKRSKTPKLGCLVVFKFSHIGRVIQIKGNRFVSSEGNTSAKTYDRNGGMVENKEYNINDKNIDCFLLFDDEDTNVPETVWRTTGKAISTGDRVNVRLTPNGEIFRQVNKGNEFLVNGVTSGGWTNVNVEGVVGWIATQYVKIVEAYNGSPSIPLRYTNLKSLAEYLNVREEPSLSANITGYMKLNEVQNFTERIWKDGRCWFNCSKGWVSGKYLTGWVYDASSRKWWYLQEGYTYPVNKWMWIEGKCYYFDDNGYMLADCYIAYKDYYCYVNDKGEWIPEADTKVPDSKKYTIHG